MLQILRNKAQSIVVQAIVVIIALVFVFWGVGNQMGSRQAAIMVNEEEISFQDFERAYQQAYDQMASQFGGNLPKGLAESLGIKQQVITQLVQGALLRQGADQMGIIVSQEDIQSTLKNMVQFQENGVFNLEKYKQLLANNQLTPHKYETSMRHDMLNQKAFLDISRFAAHISDYEVEELYKQQLEKVAVNYIKISPESFKSDITIDEAELAKWFETNSVNYKSKPQLKLSYLDYSFDTVGEKISVDSARVQQYYQDNITRYTNPEARHARHILLKADANSSQEVHEEQQQKAKDILALAKASDDFANLAREYSEGPSKENGGDLGFFSQGQMVPAFEQAVFAMNVGDISEVVKTNFGYHIIKVEAIRQAATTPLTSVEATIQQTLKNQEAQPMARELAQFAYEGIIAAGSLKSFLDAHSDQPLKETDFFSQNNPPEDLADNPEFLAKAFSLNSGELSSLITTPNGYYILYAEAVKEPVTPALDEVKDQVTTDFIAGKSVEFAESSAQEILDKLRGGEQFADLATQADLPLESSGLLGRNDTAESPFPLALVEGLFTLSSVSPYPKEPGRVGDDFYVFSFSERQPPEITEATDLKPYRDQLLRAKQQEMFGAFINNLEVDAKITQHSSL